MSLELLTLIASLCMMPNGASPNSGWLGPQATHSHQLVCQQYYVKCVKSKKKIEDCILEKGSSTNGEYHFRGPNTPGETQPKKEE